MKTYSGYPNFRPTARSPRLGTLRLASSLPPTALSPVSALLSRYVLFCCSLQLLSPVGVVRTL